MVSLNRSRLPEQDDQEPFDNSLEIKDYKKEKGLNK